MTDSTLDGYLAQWRGANPQRALAWLFLRPAERVCFGALAAMENEWVRAVREVREPQVTAVKLGWWREEVQRSLAGEARHPLTRALFADARARRVPLVYWVTAVDAATVALTTSPPADFAAQYALASPLASALADLETRIWFGAGVDGARAAKVTLFAWLVSNLRALAAEVERGRSPLPMSLLARHGLTLESLAASSPGRRAALGDCIAEFKRGLTDAAAVRGPLTLFRGVGLRHDLAALGRATRAREPLSALRTQERGLGALSMAWRAARVWRATARAKPP